MTKMTIQQFAAWAAAAPFTESQHIDGQTETEISCYGEYDEDGEYQGDTSTTKTYASVWKTLEAPLDGTAVEITYQRDVEWVGSVSERHEDSYTSSEISNGETWVLAGVEFIDEDGDVITGWERDEALAEVMDEHTNITEIDYEALIPAIATTDIDIDEDADMETITLNNDNAPDLCFTGELVASASSSANNASGYYSGSVGRWTELKLYKTASGKFIAQSIGHTQWQGEHTRYKSVVCADEAAVIAFFGHGWLAKALYEDAGIVDTTEID